MDRPAGRPDPVERALRRAATARASATRAGEIAERLEQRSAGATSELTALLLSTAARHRESEQRFRSVATLHLRHAERLRSTWATAAGRGAFIAAVADILDQPSTAISLLGAQRKVLASAASDALARMAQDLELTLGEGPVHDVAATGPLIPVLAGSVTGTDLTTRWPIYGSGLGSLGVRSVIAAPLRLAGTSVGALVAFSPSPTMPTNAVARIHTLAAGLMDTPPASGDDPTLIDSLGLASLLEETEIDRAVHQAAGMVSVQLGISIDDAYAVLRARAFADGEDVTTLAARIVRSDVRFT